LGLNLVGLGPGGEQQLTPEARETLLESEVILGYRRYLNQVEHFLDEPPKTRSYELGQEVERAEHALELLTERREVSLVSSGDIGIYAMASPVLEMLEARGMTSVELEVVPGITALSAASARLGAPVAQDFAVISLSDLLTPMDQIMNRVEHAGKGDFVVAFYNPRSANRSEHLPRALDRLRRHRSGSTPVGVVWSAYRDEEASVITTLDEVPVEDVDMFATVIVGNSKTRRYGDWLYTPRGYEGVADGS
jgi:precorrin-3B C17-methyltransferase